MVAEAAGAKGRLPGDRPVATVDQVLDTPETEPVGIRMRNKGVPNPDRPGTRGQRPLLCGPP